MKGAAKTLSYGAAAICTGVLAYCYSREHARVLQPAPGASRALMFVYLGLFLVGLVAVGVLFAYEIRKFVANRAERWLIQGGPPSEPVPELEEAARLRAAGEPLEAIRVLREYLQANPYQLHAMTRIAEIYRYDLKNDLAAALEYEELLKHQLPDDQWAWAALHLAKLYGRLNQLEKSVALLERLDHRYAHTIAGRRAKKALAHVRNPDEQASEPVGSEEGAG
jgi:tetratricopeptide (TPR) repeat protein